MIVNQRTFSYNHRLNEASIAALQGAEIGGVLDVEGGILYGEHETSDHCETENARGAK